MTGVHHLWKIFVSNVTNVLFKVDDGSGGVSVVVSVTAAEFSHELHCPWLFFFSLLFVFIFGFLGEGILDEGGRFPEG